MFLIFRELEGEVVLETFMGDLAFDTGFGGYWGVGEFGGIWRLTRWTLIELTEKTTIENKDVLVVSRDRL